jgi:autotransporter-associated beta strand protein
MKSKLVLSKFLLPSAILLAASSAHAASATWNLPTAGSWSTGGNWSPASAPGATSGTTNTDTATFGNVITAARTITVDSGRNISVIDFNANDFTYTLSGGSLVLTSGGIIRTSGAGATHNADTINSAITLANATAATSGTLSILGLSSNAERGLVISGGITGAATTGGTSTLTLGGTTVSNTGTRQNKITGDIADGLGGGTLAVEKTGTGLWVLEGAKTFSGGLTIREGELRIANSGAAAGTGAITLGDTSGTAAAIFRVASSVAPTNALTVAAGSSGIKTLTVGNVGTPGYNGAITLNANLTVSVATENNTSTNFTLGGASGISLNANTLTLLLAPINSNTITSTITVNKAVSGTGGIEIVGAGNNSSATRVVAINGTNSYTGGTIVAATGTDKSLTVNVSGDQSAATGGWTISNATPNTNTYTVNFLSGSTIGVAAGKDMTLLNGGANKVMNVAGTVTTGATGNLNVRGNSTLNLDSGADWTQNGGFINIQPQASATSAVMNVNSGASFTYAGGNDINLARSTGSGNGSATLNLGGGTFTTGKGFSNSLAGAGGGTTNLNFSSGGTIKLSANIASLVIQGASTFNVTTGTGGGVIDTNGFSTALDVGVSGAGGLTKAGAGTLTLGAANTYNGDTTVNEGTLIVNGSTDALSAMSIISGATIGGTGMIGGTLEVSGRVAPGDTVVPGNIGTLKAGAATTWNAGNAWQFDLASSGTASDKLEITGDFTKGTGSGFLFDFMGSTPEWNKTFTLVTWTVSSGFALGDFDLAGSLATLGGGSYSTSSFTLNTNSLQFTAIPEPTTALAGLLLTAGLLRRRRK